LSGGDGANDNPSEKGKSGMSASGRVIIGIVVGLLVVVGGLLSARLPNSFLQV
jgi:hypothetical protein